MKGETVSIPVAGRSPVSGILCVPTRHTPGNGTGVVLAHGAGNDMHNPLLTAIAEGLSEKGFPTLRFNFPYRERGGKSPDAYGVLTEAWRAAISFFSRHERAAPQAVIASGKSLGGRIASQMAAEDGLNADALIFFGYPLHAPGKKNRLKDEHLYAIRMPMLFFAGTRDTLCDVPSLERVVQKLTDAELCVVDGGDHSFNVPASLHTQKREVYAGIVVKTAAWLKKLA